MKNRLFPASGLAVLLSVLAVLVEAGPKCGALMPNTGFPHAPAMDGSVKTGFEGSDDDCCALCAAKKGECAAFTHRIKNACYLHPASSPLGDTAPAGGANSAYMPSVPTPAPAPTPPTPPPTPHSCPPRTDGLGYFSAPVMQQSVATNYNGSALDCCSLCFATKPDDYNGCAGFTYVRGACLLHPGNVPIGNATAPPAGSNATDTSCAVIKPCKIKPEPLPPLPISPPPRGAKNVIFLVSDDMRPEMLEAYGRREMLTPHFDALARSSAVFQRAYCQQAICGPSRNSFMSGRRPQRTQGWNFHNHFREPRGGVCGNETARTEDGRTWISFPGYFKTHGYTTLGGGKLYHGGLPPYNDGTNLELGGSSWTQAGPRSKDCQDLKNPNCHFPNPDNSSAAPAYVENGGKHGCTSDYFIYNEPNLCPDNSTNHTEFIDGANVDDMLLALEYAAGQRKAKGTPFFVAQGFHRPHLPFHFPAAFNSTYNIWEAYGPAADIAVPRGAARHAPAGMPGIAFTYEMDGRTHVAVNHTNSPIPGPDVPAPGNTSDLWCPYCGPTLPDWQAQLMRKAYYASVSWVDHLVGRLMAKLEELGHADDTVIAFVGDHGWQLGEHNIWGKHTNFELGARVPLLIKAPGQVVPVRTAAIVESVDIYPTVAALAGLPPPPDVDGTDLSPLWSAPNGSSPKPVNAAFSEYPRCAPPGAAWTPEPGASAPQSCINTNRANFTVMGYSVRSEEWRATFWMWWDGLRLVGDFERGPVAVELYAHKGDLGSPDYDAWENENVAESNPDAVASLLAMARTHWAKPKARGHM